jgi:hypothetical protein
MPTLSQGDIERGRLPTVAEFTIRVWVFAIMLALLTAGCGSSQVAVPTTKPMKYSNGLTAAEVFNLRTKCSEIVDKLSNDYVIGVVGAALTSQVSSHYNPEMNRCYAEVVVTKNFSYDYKAHPVPDNYRSTALYDAQTKNLLIHADQEGAKSFANDFTNQAGSFEDYDKGLKRIEELMQEDVQ